MVEAAVEEHPQAVGLFLGQWRRSRTSPSRRRQLEDKGLESIWFLVLGWVCFFQIGFLAVASLLVLRGMLLGRVQQYWCLL